ncbi:YveK family protein [Bacillus rubiinfantis]|uniref:YveK family protein n=1 Tax=Bacillus rubiinfantis TaxID=1499680 RepID=UPI0005A60619|nr:Wzz/FepE/Etk N-terminal domain-containing protein [Bacillus rubiinfantis]
MHRTINLVDILKILKKRWKLISFFIIAVTAMSAALSYYVLKPVYQAKTQILVSQKNSENQLDYTLLQSNVNLISTYSDIIKSPVMMEMVANRLQLNESIEELNKSITVTSQENSQVFTLVVENHDHVKAVNIVNTLSETFQEEIKGIMNVDNVIILAWAEVKDNPIPVKPNHLFNITIAIVVGIMVGISLALIIELFDNTFKDEIEVEEFLGLPVLGSVQKIPRTTKKEKNRSKTKKVEGETFVS